MKKRWKILLGVLAIFVLAAVGMMMFLQTNLNNLVNQEIADIDIQSLKDGTYVGEYSSTPVTAKVQVDVQDGRIVHVIILQHDHGQGEPGEAIVETVISEQSLDVDSISGATYSSRVILKAIEVALTGE